ncbi:hypothetical protein ACLOJK_010349 [Asimina triloba]
MQLTPHGDWWETADDDDDDKIRSAFSMAHSLLTDVKAIMGLGPNRSILGTIIRPDPVLLERKGGSNGDMTFDILLPGAGQPLERELADEHAIQCNWQLYDDEPLPRERVIVKDESGEYRKRKALKSKQLAEEAQNGERTEIRNESKSRKNSGRKKQRHRQWGDQDREDGYVGSSHLVPPRKSGLSGDGAGVADTVYHSAVKLFFQAVIRSDTWAVVEMILVSEIAVPVAEETAQTKDDDTVGMDVNTDSHSAEVAVVPACAGSVFGVSGVNSAIDSAAVNRSKADPEHEGSCCLLTSPNGRCKSQLLFYIWQSVTCFWVKGGSSNAAYCFFTR